MAYKFADFTTWFEDSDEPVAGSHLWVLRQLFPDFWRVSVVAWSTHKPSFDENVSKCPA
jgi:hypothetical protein